jgi:hypothetical protein
MSLIYAQVTGNLIYFLADTFSESSIGKAQNWFAEPLIKIMQLGEYVFAYAGNSILAAQCLQANYVHEANVLLQTLCQSSSQGEVDYAICKISSKHLWFVKDGELQERASGYLGSKQGFELFQKHRNTNSQISSTEMHVTELPDGLSENESEAYSRSLSAFKAALIDTDGTFGGIAIPYVLSELKCGYGTYTSVYRGPLEESEVPLFGASTVQHQDSHRGAYRVEVWGDKSALAIYLPDAMTGRVFASMDGGASSTVYHQIDGYDFTDLARDACCGDGGVSTWQSWPHAANKVRQYLFQQKFDRVQSRLREIEGTIISSLRGRNPEGLIRGEIGIDFISELSAYGVLRLNIDVINCISTLFELRYQYYDALNQFDFRDSCQRQLATWQATVAAISLELRLK